jgi:flagellum-specific ATP synthase
MNEAVNWQQSDQRLKQVLELRNQLQNQQQNVAQTPMLMDGNTRRF